MSFKITYEKDSVQKGHYTLKFEGDFDDLQQSAFALEVKILELLQKTNLKILIVDASDAAINSQVMCAWMDIVEKHLKNCQVIYKESQLMLCAKYDQDYTSKRPNDVFIDY